ncbi:hypothetical protein [Hydrogenophaga sp. PAMC20947]|uniref:hypothetical protein n=1 Tax=Hydrogenophaga sp. PAMC20947 TaxID=2565558 RepID=UPI00109DA8EA|nr:hypothetical protein [Hydrogenophaga sp. PAMC20947]QCB47458.1 hypothetical protein E5678_16375 [Hydrogenophaga sp. PAMC20947]
MPNHSEALATAAHLHVLLRRKTGRVTDTEWMASNPEYALAMIEFTRSKAHGEALAELRPWADKLEALIPTMGARDRKPLLAAAVEHFKTSARDVQGSDRKTLDHRVSGFRESGLGRGTTPTVDQRYVGGIR